jgi:hypothetical protein
VVGNSPSAGYGINRINTQKRRSQSTKPKVHNVVHKGTQMKTKPARSDAVPFASGSCVWALRSVRKNQWLGSAGRSKIKSRIRGWGRQVIERTKGEGGLCSQTKYTTKPSQVNKQFGHQDLLSIADDSSAYALRRASLKTILSSGS